MVQPFTWTSCRSITRKNSSSQILHPINRSDCSPHCPLRKRRQRAAQIVTPHTLCQGHPSLFLRLIGVRHLRPVLHLYTIRLQPPGPFRLKRRVIHQLKPQVMPASHLANGLNGPAPNRTRLHRTVRHPQRCSPGVTRSTATGHIDQIGHHGRRRGLRTRTSMASAPCRAMPSNLMR
jgi:hypothetical protein